MLEAPAGRFVAHGPATQKQKLRSQTGCDALAT